MKVLAEIPPRPSADLATGKLRRGDLDAYDALLSRLPGVRCLLVTGDGPGRCSVAAGLAATAAAAGSSVALLECDLAAPELAHSLGLASAPGLHEYLRGTVEAEAVLKPVVLAGPGSVGATEPLVCVVAGRPASDGSALLASDRFREAIEGLRAAYEIVAISGPPLGDEYALRSIIGLVDATVACVPKRASRRKLGVPVTGLVLRG